MPYKSESTLQRKVLVTLQAGFWWCKHCIELEWGKHSPFHWPKIPFLLCHDLVDISPVLRLQEARKIYPCLAVLFSLGVPRTLCDQPWERLVFVDPRPACPELGIHQCRRLYSETSHYMAVQGNLDLQEGSLTSSIMPNLNHYRKPKTKSVKQTKSTVIRDSHTRTVNVFLLSWKNMGAYLHQDNLLQTISS